MFNRIEHVNFEHVWFTEGLNYHKVNESKV